MEKYISYPRTSVGSHLSDVTNFRFKSKARSRAHFIKTDHSPISCQKSKSEFFEKGLCHSQNLKLKFSN